MSSYSYLNLHIECWTVLSCHFFLNLWSLFFISFTIPILPLTVDDIYEFGWKFMLEVLAEGDLWTGRGDVARIGGAGQKRQGKVFWRKFVFNLTWFRQSQFSLDTPTQDSYLHTMHLLTMVTSYYQASIYTTTVTLTTHSFNQGARVSLIDKNWKCYDIFAWNTHVQLPNPIAITKPRDDPKQNSPLGHAWFQTFDYCVHTDHNYDCRSPKAHG